MTSPPSETGIEFDPSMLRQAVVTILRGADRSLVSAKGVRKELQVSCCRAAGCLSHSRQETDGGTTS